MENYSEVEKQSDWSREGRAVATWDDFAHGILMTVKERRRERTMELEMREVTQYVVKGTQGALVL